MKITTSKIEDTVNICLAGRMDTIRTVEFQNMIDELSDEDAGHVVVNCKDLEYISSSGLRAFIALLKKAQRNGGKVELLQLNDNVKEVFDMTGVSSLFGIS